MHTMVKDAQGTMMMKQVEGISVPANGTAELKPGSFHVMLFGLNRELKVGDTFPLTLKYEQGGEQTIQVQVKEKN
jgi:copper(I)-binding protein